MSLDGLARTFAFGLIILLLALALYLPFHIGFRSQASGVLPNAIFPTRLPNFLVMFGPLLPIVIWLMIAEAAPWRRGRGNWIVGIALAISILTVLVGLTAVVSQLALHKPLAQDFLLQSAGLEPTALPLDSDARAEALTQAFGMAISRRLNQPWVALLLTALLALGFGRLLRERDVPVKAPPELHVSDFVILLFVTGALLTLGPEFIYIRDTFGHRLNTIFKFYCAAWILFAVGAAYAVWHIANVRRDPPKARGLFIGLATLLTVAGLVYPLLAIPTKADFNATPTLDGIAYIENVSPDDLEGIRWLQANADPNAIVLEAIGGQYSYYGRVSTTTGLQTLLGWPGHELQWRGSLELAGSREADVETIYTTPDIRVAQTLLEQYGVTYVFVGSLEKGYGTPAGLEKFARFLTPLYDNGEVTIYRADQPLAETP